MALTENQDFEPGYDPTGASSLEGSQVLQTVQEAEPTDSRGLGLWTKDTAANVPDVPDADTVTKFKRYHWIREPFSTGNTKIYVWNEYTVSDATYLKWVEVAVTNISAGSITTTMLANLSVTDAKIQSVSLAKITDFPAQWYNIGSAAAGGDLAGTYPNPTIAAGVVNASKLASDAVTTAKILDANVTTAKIADNAITPAKVSDTLGAKLVQRVFASDGALINIDTSAAGSVIPLDDTIPQKSEGQAILTTAQFTPTALTNYLYFKLIVNMSADMTGSAAVRAAIAAIFVNEVDGGVNNDALAASARYVTGDTGGDTYEDLPFVLVVEGIKLVSDIISVGLEAITIQANVGISSALASSNIFINGSLDEARKFGGVSSTILIVEEYRP